MPWAYTTALLTSNVDSYGLLVSFLTFAIALGSEYSVLWTIYQTRSIGPIDVPCEISMRQIALWRTVFSAASQWLAARSVPRNL
jgi:hypothetical protein